MDKINDGGPAFPQHWRTQPQDMGTSGCTLRDYFAAKAMQAMTSSPQYCERGWDIADLTKQAYDLADAMLKARG